LDELDGCSDLEEDDGDTGIEDDPKGFDLETDYCLAHEDRGALPLTAKNRSEIRRVKRAVQKLKQMRAA
jgi:hypothetical protein